MAFLLRILVLIMRGLYALAKLLPVNPDKVFFVSRQSDQEPLDFQLLSQELKSRRPGIRIVSMHRRYDSALDYAMFPFMILISLVHLSTSRVCVLDSYWPAVSVLHHKPSLFVMQLWHSIGKMKKSGLSAAGTAGGRGKSISRLLKMHQNYDAVIAGGSAWNDFYCESFGITKDKILNLGLPRMDFMIHGRASVRERIHQVYPAMKTKKVVLYAPTFRRWGEDPRWQGITDGILWEDVVFIIKPHPNQPLSIPQGALSCPEFSALELLAAADWLITDYSAILLEGALLDVDTYFFLYDYDEYTAENGLNIDLKQTLGPCVFEHAPSLWNQLLHGEYPREVMDAFKKKYLPRQPGQSTREIAGVILEKMDTIKE